MSFGNPGNKAKMVVQLYGIAKFWTLSSSPSKLLTSLSRFELSIKMVWFIH